MNCYICDIKLTKDNETEEHILLNSIGGKLKSKKLMCKDCNSRFGSDIDHQLSKQLNPIANLLDIKRDRGEPQNIKGKYRDREVIIEPGGKIKWARPYIEKGEKVIHIEASSVGEATKVLKGLQRSYPEMDIEKALHNHKKGKKYLESVTIGLTFGGIDIKRAICKMAVNYFVDKGGDPSVIKHLLPFIESKENCDSIKYFYPRREVFYKEAEEILHSIVLIGNAKTKCLFVYVELFNEFKFVVTLSNDYDGMELYESYHYNLVTNEVVIYDAPLTISPRELKQYCSDDIDESKFRERMKLLFQRIDKVTVSRRIHTITQNAMDEMVAKFPPDKYPVFTTEMISFLSQKVAQEFVLSFQNRFFKDGKDKDEEC
ncbi:HNH endonuclease [Paenibacillus tarimensis]|uniref:HNH endonuclease n=1 Tax=Paenibacillus tarimensis TaxID=416012 RepID=UPI001F263750|nr:HNH endonuclease [Paenibacillus tarimensis]MCF2946334.1 HNH endonuclease [Paenibacillus tarimensis]